MCYDTLFQNGIGRDSSTDSETDDDLDDAENKETNDIKLHIDWNTELPVSVSVPVVTIHSLIFDFGQVIFLDVVAVDTLKGVSEFA